MLLCCIFQQRGLIFLPIVWTLVKACTESLDPWGWGLVQDLALPLGYRSVACCPTLLSSRKPIWNSLCSFLFLCATVNLFFCLYVLCSRVSNWLGIHIKFPFSGFGSCWPDYVECDQESERSEAGGQTCLNRTTIWVCKSLFYETPA